MKRVFVFIIIFLSFMLKASAQIDEAKHCAVVDENKVVNKSSKLVSEVTGSNFISSKAVEFAIQNIIKKQLGAKTTVKIYPYSFGSLLQGKFKKMTINSKALAFSGIHISSFDAETICNYNQIGIKGNNLLFKENFVMKFLGKIDNKDLEKTTNSPTYSNLMKSLKISVLGQDVFKINYIKPKIENNKLYMDINAESMILWGEEKKSYLVSSDLSVENGKIMYSNMSIENATKHDNIQALLSLINLANPFNFSIKLSENSFGYTFIKDVIIENNEIKINGVLFIPKNN